MYTIIEGTSNLIFFLSSLIFSKKPILNYCTVFFLVALIPSA